MEFSRQEYCSGLPFPSPGNLPNPGIKPRSPALQADSLLSELPGKPNGCIVMVDGFYLSKTFFSNKKDRKKDLLLKRRRRREFPDNHWLRFHVFIAKGLSSIPGPGTKITQAMQCGKKEKRKN